VGIVTTSSATAFKQSAAAVYDLATNPANWPKLYPGSAHVGEVPTHLPLRVGDTWTEAGPDASLIFTWQLAIATRPKLWMFNSVGRLGHDHEGNGGIEGRITVEYHFTQPGADITLFTRTMTIEAYKDAPLPDEFFLSVNPAAIDQYHAAIARELARSTPAPD
jgi:hypothetical protein